MSQAIARLRLIRSACGMAHLMDHDVPEQAVDGVALRAQGIKPPSLDLLFYLPMA